MTHAGRRAAFALATGLTLSLGAVAHSAPTSSNNATTPRIRFMLPGGEVLTGRVVSSEGSMYVIRLAHGTMMVRKDFLVAVKTLDAQGRPTEVSREISGGAHSAPTKPIL